MKKAYRKPNFILSVFYNNKIKTGLILLMLSIFCWPVFAQQSIVVKGQIIDSNKNPIVGATILLKEGRITTGTSADENGVFTLKVSSLPVTFEVSFIGMKTKKVQYNGQKNLIITLEYDNALLSEVVVVGYGQQKKESVVGAISQTKGAVLQRQGGVTSVGQALTGNLPGVTTVSGAGAPGDEDPTIYIRGQGTWNNSSPLILIDGIERSLSGVDVNSIQSVSVLKDASATAVFGVKGANGVILITTKRGQEGKASISVSANSTVKFRSNIPYKYDSYDALMYRNEAIEREVGIDESSWDKITPYSEIQKYRDYTSDEQRDRYPNVDWSKELFKKYCISTNANINVSGGTSFVKYYASMDYDNEGDLMRTKDNGKGYTPGYGYKRVNVRSNLDFQLTNTTKFSVNLAGYYANRQRTYVYTTQRLWKAAYTMEPDVFQIKYSDGSWGAYPENYIGKTNSIRVISNSGIKHDKTTKLNTDFILTQDLKMFIPGLQFQGKFSMDNTFQSEGGLNDSEENVYQKWIDPVTGETLWANSRSGSVGYDFALSPWTVQGDQVKDYATYRKIFYQLQLSYNQQFGKHNVSAMGLFSRDQYASGSEYAHYREDWVFRTTYNYNSRYFFEMNGSYNGSEKFGVNYRFHFFPSLALGWMLSDEPFMKWSKGFLNMFKFRASYGIVGDDSGGGRWLYMSQWSYGGHSNLGVTAQNYSPYEFYKESSLGNEDIHWEKVSKQNYGVDYDFFDGLLAGSLDIFKDKRSDILLSGSSRSIPSFFGATPATVNMGKVNVQGFELVIRSNYTCKNKLHAWANLSITHAVDRIIYADNAKLLPEYQKSEGFQVGQPKQIVQADYYNNWDEMYGTTPLKTYDTQKLPGNKNFIDFNSDGIIDDYDYIASGYPSRPQNNYNLSFGVDYKGWGVYLQFYAVNNASRSVQFYDLGGADVLHKLGSYWSPESTNADYPLPRWNTNNLTLGNQFQYDASYVRLKTAEISYTWTKANRLEKIGISSLKIYMNGNNLAFWSNLPDDRESENGGDGQFGAYPTSRRVNFGVKIKF